MEREGLEGSIGLEEKSCLVLSLFIILIQKMMLSQIFSTKAVNNKIVKVHLGRRNQLKIEWNFNGMLMPKVFRRHIFICLSNKQEEIEKAQETMQHCFEFFKYGDLYTSALPYTKKFNWNEKSKIDQFRSLFGNNIKQKFEYTTQCYLKNQLLSLSKFRQPTFIVLFCDPEHDVEMIEKFIHQFREDQKLNGLVFIVSKKYNENNIDFSIGMCKIAYRSERNLDFQNIYKFYNDRLACIEAQITFQSITGDVFIGKGAWKSRSFTSFSRKIYYPIASYYIDVIETQKLYSETIKSWNFNIKLQYKLLNGETFLASKETKIPLEPNIDRRITYNHEDHKQMRYQLFVGMELQINPFYKVTSLESGVKKTSVQ